MRETVARYAGRAAFWAFLGTVALVGLVGVVGVVARTIGSWTWLFRFEQTATAAVPITLSLAGISLVGAVGAAVLTPID